MKSQSEITDRIKQLNASAEQLESDGYILEAAVRRENAKLLWWAIT